MASQRWKDEGIRIIEEIICRAVPEPELSTSKNGVRTNGTSEEVEFSDDYSRVFSRNGFAFFAFYRGQPLRFVVSCDTLVKLYGAKGADIKSAEPTFLANKSKLRDLAKSLLHQSVESDEGEIIIG